MVGVCLASVGPEGPSESRRKMLDTRQSCQNPHVPGYAILQRKLTIKTSLASRKTTQITGKLIGQVEGRIGRQCPWLGIKHYGIETRKETEWTKDEWDWLNLFIDSLVH